MKNLTLTFFLTLFLVSCSKDIDDEPNLPTNENKSNASVATDLDVRDFIWKGLNTYYLWQEDIPNLADNRFASSVEQTFLKNEKYFNFLNSYKTPYELFESLKYPKDRFSWIVDDYEILEQHFQGISQSTGMDFELIYIEKTNNILGFVRYVIPNTSASEAGIKRGHIFTKVDGVTLTKNNYRALLFSQNASFTINSVHIENHTLVPDNTTYPLTKQRVEENSVFIHKIFEKGGKKIGYLMYNSYTSPFDLHLNEVFGKFKSAGINELILDLRYNGGGAISSAIYLSSMITGQFNKMLFAKNRWNNKLQPYIEKDGYANNYFTNTIKGHAINSLKLNKIYIIATGNTASASELTINGLRAYIDVIHVGSKTVGKNQGSITVKDWVGNGKVNPNHKWAMQPIVLKIENAEGFGNYEDGLKPNIEIEEDIANLGVLGEEDEPLLARTLALITGSTQRIHPRTIRFPDHSFIDSKSFEPLFQEMYLTNDIPLKK